MLVQISEVKCPTCFSDNYLLPMLVKKQVENQDFFCMGCGSSFHGHEAHLTSQKVEIHI